jgi:beta-galactosidase
MYYGVQYYPEHWPEERWAVDAAMMKKAGVNIVRMGEFAWSYYEPRDGELSFEKYDRALALLHDHGIKTILCTCSRTVPPWLMKRYPGIINADYHGRPHTPGSRYLVGHLHPDFVRESQRIDRAVIEHFAGNPAVEAWQIDNEIGSHNDCYCDACVARFREYLAEKYKTTEALNHALGEHFWSGSYSDFSEVPRPSGQPQLELEYRRFMSKANCEFNRWRTDLIRVVDPGKWITTNFQSVGTQHTDYREMARDLDVNGMNHYPKRSPELILDYYRQGDRPLIVLEQFTRLLDVDAGEGWMRLWAWMAIAHGCCGINFFRWRGCRWGQEQFADGLLPHSGKENRLYRELARMGGELKQLGKRVDAAVPDAHVAITFGYDARWATRYIQSRANQINCVSEAVRVHDSLMRQNVTTDGLDPREDLSKYKLVIAPQLMIVDDESAENLRAFVENGGILCLTAHSGVVDEFGKSFDTPRPGPLAEMAGIEVSDMALLEKPFTICSEHVPGLNGQSCNVLADEIQVTTADVLATFGSGWRKGLPALTCNRWGKGKVHYLGTVIAGQAMDALTGHLCDQAGIEPIMPTPPGVRAYERRNDTERLIFILNYTEQPQTVELPCPGKDAYTGDTVRTVDIGPVDLRIVSL